MSKKMILIVGKTSTGKTSSLRNLPLEKTVYIDTDRKGIKSFRDMDKFKEWVKLDYVDHLIPGLEALEVDDECEYVVLDTLSLAFDMFYTQKISGAVDSRAQWSAYKDWFNKLIQFIKTSKKHYIILSHEKTTYNEEMMETSTMAYAQGSVYSRIEENFAVVAYTQKFKKDDEIKYGFQVNPTKEHMNTSAKSPMGMFTEPLVEDNDVMILFEAIDNY